MELSEREVVDRTNRGRLVIDVHTSGVVVEADEHHVSVDCPLKRKTPHELGKPNLLRNMMLEDAEREHSTASVR